MERELSALDITPTAFYAIDPVSVWTVPEVDSPTDMGGIKIRAWDEASAAVGRALGADPQVMGFYDVYAALQRGVVEGGITGSAAVAAASWYEFCKHGYLVGLPPNTYYLCYNDEAFSELPCEYQVILLEEAARMSDLHLKKSPAEFRKINQILLDNGMTLHEVSSADRSIIASRLTPLWQEWADNGGPVAQELLDIALDVLGITM
jgi:TRAP-type C4-dicarboxylate transport system substrate-binding protein